MGSRIGLWIPAIACLLVVAATAEAAPPNDANYQGLLLDSVGDPLPGPVDIQIAVWDQLIGGGTPLYWETHSGVPLVDGVFNILLGTGTVMLGTFDADLFATENRYLEVIVDSEALQPRQPFSSVAYALRSEASEAAAHAATAGDADTVDGSHAASLDQSAHVSDTGNPHGVTAGQVGAATSSELASHAGDTSAHHAKTTTFGELTDQAADAQIPVGITRDDELAAGLAGKADAGHLHDERYFTEAEVLALVGSLSDRLTYLEGLLEDVTRVGNDITFSGVNVHVVNGDGITESKNGLGNLIVGYNEPPPVGEDRSGSHNIVTGSQHNYSSWGGLVAGKANTISGEYASVTAGYSNAASGSYSSVSGGENNKASGSFSSVAGGGSPNTGWSGNEAFANHSAILGGAQNLAGDPDKLDRMIGHHSTVSGGQENTASGSVSSVTGGSGNLASAGWSSVTGGQLNEASEFMSWVSGGYENTASAWNASVSGGRNNEAAGGNSSVTGGRNNKATGDSAVVVGGGSDNPLYGNEAFGNYSAVLGGIFNIAGDPDRVDHSIGEKSTVSGGDTNRATGTYSSVVGGKTNTASGDVSTVGGGRYNEASGGFSFVGGGGGENSVDGNIAFAHYSAILGGLNNLTGDGICNWDGGLGRFVCTGGSDHAVGPQATVSGGSFNKASGDYASVSGGRSNDATGENSSVSGGDQNTASGKWSSASGGIWNTASGEESSVSGGSGRTASGSDDWVAGSLFQDF
jgi:hypothetical protein